MKKILFLIPLLMSFGCTKKNQATAPEPVAQPDIVVSKVQPIASRPMNTILKATAFKMSGAYQNNVAVTLNADGTLAYFPAPSDITENSRPVELEDGWWLNRQGLGPNSVFTKYTFEEYSKLPSVPTPDEIKAAIIPGARVSYFKKLSYPAGEAMKYLPQIKEELK